MQVSSSPVPSAVFSLLPLTQPFVVGSFLLINLVFLPFLCTSCSTDFQ
jgi:hypothetical protein